jgi:hypothetical protein
MRAVVPLLVLTLVRCSPSDPTLRRGVDDVKAACEIRAAWTTPTADACVACQSTAILERCACESLREFSGACFEEAERARREPSCAAEISPCVRACEPGDCACEDACYEGRDACRTAASVREGCVADVCAPFCGGS